MAFLLGGLRNVQVLSRTTLLATCLQRPVAALATSAAANTFRRSRDDEKSPYPEPKRWPNKNFEVFPPQESGELRRRAEYCHHRSNIKYSPKKFWYICSLIRGMSVDEAIKQLALVNKKGAHIMKEVIEEAREVALQEHNFEYKSNMFIGECNCAKGLVIKGYRKHARYRFGEIRYFHSHVFVRLVEGPPPEHFYHADLYYTNRQKLDIYLDDLRKRNIQHSCK